MAVRKKNQQQSLSVAQGRGGHSQFRFVEREKKVKYVGWLASSNTLTIVAGHRRWSVYMQERSQPGVELRRFGRCK